jgi:hypothetical protein
MRHVLIAAAVFVGLAACSPPGEGASGPADAPAALPPGRPAIYEAARVGPEEFVRALYAVHATPGASMGEPPRPGQEPIYGRMLNAMIGADFAKAAGEVPTLNHDPICDCQDSGDFTLVSVTVTSSVVRASAAWSSSTQCSTHSAEKAACCSRTCAGQPAGGPESAPRK